LTDHSVLPNGTPAHEYTMLDRPWSAEEQARLDATPRVDPLDGMPPPLEPIEGEQEAYWESLVGEHQRTVVVPTPTIIPVPEDPSQTWRVERLSPQSWKVISPADAAYMIFRYVWVDK